MTIRNLLNVITLSLLFISCGSNSGKKKKLFSLTIPNNQAKFKLDETLSLSINNPNNIIIDSIIYRFDNQLIKKVKGNLPLNEKFDTEKLGYKKVNVEIFHDGTSDKLSKKITLLNNKAPKLYKFKIVASYPHDQNAFTQGLEFVNDTLYESTGRNGFSSLRKVDYKTGKVLVKKEISQQYFAEGITIHNNKIYQLTWLAKEGFIYNLNTLTRDGNFAYGESKEGWGLCNDGTTIYKSDGSEKIWFLNSQTLEEESYIQVATNKSVKSNFNELEWIDGKIYANTWPKNGATNKAKLKSSISIINPKNGALEAVIDLRDLRNHVTQHEALDVLNGIAYKADTRQLFVTGKNWDKLFEIEIIK